MGYITKLTSKSKGIRYKAVINIRKAKEGINYFDTETFSTKSLAEKWLKDQEGKLEKNPELLSIKPGQVSESMTFGAAIKKYMEEVTDYGRSKKFTLEMLQKFDIAQINICSLKRTHFGDHARRRGEGYTNARLSLDPVKPQTVNFDLQCMKSVLDYAEFVWGLPVESIEFEKAIKGLRKARLVSDSDERDRLPIDEELQKITTVSYMDFYLSENPNTPIFLIMWLAIYTSRRLNEIVRLKIANYDRDNKKWFVEGVKHPDGSYGNDKWFIVDERAEKVIDMLLDPVMRKRMLARGGDPEMLIPCSRKGVAENWRKYRDKAGVIDLKFHDLRHEAATRLAENGASIATIMQYTLHDDLNSLKRYINLDIIRKKPLEFTEALMNAKNSKLIDVL